MRRLLIFAAVDGLILQPPGQRSQRNAQAVKIKYKTNDISAAKESCADSNATSFEAHGVIGLLNVSSASFLVSITRRQQVAQIRGKPIFVITDVALTPLASQSEANSAIVQTRDALQKHYQRSTKNASEDTEDSDTSAEDDGSVIGQDDLNEDDMNIPIGSDLSATSARQGFHKRTTSIAEDVIGKKGLYGRFAEKWFSKKGWSEEKKRVQGMSAEEGYTTDDPPPLEAETSKSKEPSLEEEKTAFERGNAAQAVAGGAKNEDQTDTEVGDIVHATVVRSTLLPKLLRTTKMLLGTSRSFFYSYDYDITRTIENQDPNTSSLPLHRVVDPLYFWNRHLSLPFIDAGQHALVLPIMQGFVGQRSFSVPDIVPESVSSGEIELEPWVPENTNADRASDLVSKEEAKTRDRDFLLTLISRRSIKRAGLRYLRRGVDDEGYSANSVETEQILSRVSWSPFEKIYSFLQLRGSIPLYFSQSPYSFKPVPTIHHSQATNQMAFKKHFANLFNRYSNVQVISLVEKQGNEAILGREYENHTALFNSSSGIGDRKVQFEWFDFHAVCRGMKFEKVSLLIDSLSETLEEFRWTTKTNDKIESKQTGVLRTNCMDCLDRTNVVQSACARTALEAQLKTEEIKFSILSDRSTQWFDMLWADNGDAVSKQYSSTAALKGDFTRTRKRDYRGALNDFGLTLSRFYNNIIGDYFTQAAVDYLLGNVTSEVFHEFEADMMSGDPAISMRRIRQNAIENSSKIVIADESEELIEGWTLLVPKEHNTIRSYPFEESILLLTNTALYVCRFDWTTEKVSSFERVDLRHIRGMIFGPYITSTVAAAHTDEKRNVGFVATYEPGKEDFMRVNTRSLKSRVPKENPANPAEELVIIPTRGFGDAVGGSAESKANKIRILAFKAITVKSSLANSDPQDSRIVTEIELVRSICGEIERAALAAQRRGDGPGEPLTMVGEKPIISLAEAKKSTGLLEQLGYSLKRLVWA